MGGPDAITVAMTTEPVVTDGAIMAAGVAASAVGASGAEAAPPSADDSSAIAWASMERTTARA